ncbi:MAG: AIDA repeat-containing protein, partial [Lentisphaeria bacterium]|nr:AIDA repeat-containing protein [Lentisphaeria bacterium]
MATLPKHDTQTNRTVVLDFNGGTQVYRNPELGLNIPAQIKPGEFSAARRAGLVSKLNLEYASHGVHFTTDAMPGASTVRIGRTDAFDHFGRFLGLAEGIGSGDAFVLLDASAKDAELAAVIRHEAGHILGTLDHGGTGLARYALFWTEYDYSKAFVDAAHEQYRQYLKRKSTVTNTCISGSDDDDSFTVGAYETSTETYYEYGSYQSLYDPDHDTWYWPSPPATEYVEENYTFKAYQSLSGKHAKYRIDNSGGTITACTAQYITVKELVYRDRTDTYGYVNGSSTYTTSLVYSAPRISRGVAEGCKSTTLNVTGNAFATDCKAAKITVAGEVYAWDGWGGDDLPYGDYTVFHAVLENSTVVGTNGTYWATYDYEEDNLTGLYSSGLEVNFGGTASHVTVQSGSVTIGYGGALEAGSTTAKQWKLLGNAVVNNLVVDDGDVNVYYGGELNNAKIKGTLRIGDGAHLGGTINTTRVELANVVPTTTITIKLDLRDFAKANYTETQRVDKDEHNYVLRKIEYFANYTTRTTEYTCFRDKDGDVRYDDIRVTYDTFDNLDGRFDMTNWKYTFEADIGSVDATAMPYIVVDFGGTEKMFDSGKLKFNYPSTNRKIQFQMNSNELKWEEQWSEGDNSSYTGTILYDASLYGEAADVLWLEYGEDPEAEYTIELAPEMAGATEITAITTAGTGDGALPDAEIKGTTLVVKGDRVQDGNLVVKAEDPAHLDHECALELLVVPEEIPVIGKLGAKHYSDMLKRAQKDHITQISDVLPYNIHTKIFGLAFDLTNMGITLTVNWTEPSMELKLQGKMEWKLGKGTAGTGRNLKLVVDLSGDENFITITNKKGEYSWNIVGELKVPDFKIGKFQFSNMSLKVDKGNYAFIATGYVQLPWIKYAFGGSLGITDGYLDSMAIGTDNLNILLGGTGLFLQKIEGGISGIATDLNLSFNGTLGLTAGPKISVEFVDWLGIDSGEYSLCEMTLTGTLSTSGELEGKSNCVILGGLATGGGSAGIKDGELFVSGTYTFLNNCISIKGEMHAGLGGITITGKGTASVPREKYFGPLAGFEMSANVEAAVNRHASDSYVLAWQAVSLFGNNFSIGFKSTFEGEVTLLGATDLLKEEERDLRTLKSNIPVRSESVAAPLRDGAEPSASKTVTVNYSGLSLFQFNLTSSSASVSLTCDGAEYTQAAIAAGNFENMQVVSELSGDMFITIAVNNAASGEWTMNAYDDENATFGVYGVEGGMQKPVIASITVGADARSSTIGYTLGDLAGLENVRLSVYRTGKEAGYTGQRLVVIDKPEAEGTWEWVMNDELAGGDYAFYLMVESNGQTPVYSDISKAYTFRTVDTEAPDQIQVVTCEWKSTGTVISWEEPWDDHGVAGYRIRYATGDEDVSEADVTTNSFTFDKVPNGTYEFQVVAYDEGGNLSAWSEQQSCLVLTVGNAKYKDLTLAEPLKLEEYESAVNTTGGDISITTAANSLLSGSTIGNAEISGILDASTVTGKAVLLAGGTACAVTVNGKFEIRSGTADGITVAEGGSLVIGTGAVAKNITVNAGGSVTFQDGAEYEGLVLDYGSSLILPDGNTYRLTGDIRTAGALNTRTFLFANGHKIVFEQYRQTGEMTNPGTEYARDDVAFVTDFDKLGTGVLEIEIDSGSPGSYKIADKVASFNGTITVVDHATGTSAAVGFDDYTLVGETLCKLSKTSSGYGTSSLYLLTKTAAVEAPTITVSGADGDWTDVITVTLDSPCAKRTYRYSLNEDMSDAVVVTSDGTEPFTLAKSALTAYATYYLQAKVESSYGVESPWSETVGFTVVPKYSGAVLTVTAEKNGTTYIVLTANGMESSEYSIDAYDFRYADNPEMDNAVSSTSYQSEAWIERTNFVEGQDYYIQVRAFSRGEWGDWGPTLVYNTEGYDYDGITVGDDTYLQLNGGKKARNITVTTGGIVYGGGGKSVDGITLNDGIFYAGCPVTDAVVNGGLFALLANGSVSDLIVNGGTASLWFGTLNGATVGPDATMDITNGIYEPTITGTILIQGGMMIYEDHPGITTDASFVFDLGAHESESMRDRAFVDYIAPLSGAKSFTVKLDDTPEAGDYRLAGLNETDTISLSFNLAANDGTVLGVLAPGGESILHNGLYYSVYQEYGVVSLHVSGSETPPEPPTPSEYVAKFDIDGNGVSDVMFVWTGEHGDGNYQHGYWMNGTSEWQSANSNHPAEWDNLGCYDMTGDGKADSVLFGNVTSEAGIKGAYIGYYADANDLPDGSTWVNIGYLTNEKNIDWKN